MTTSSSPKSTVSSKRKLESEDAAQEQSKAVKVQEEPTNIYESFFPGLFDTDNVEKLRNEITNSGPYKHGVIRQLIDDSLLRKVRKEILENLHFTKKETDIYKVYQTGDLRNLSGLDKSELEKLSGLFRVREALYSKEFREYLSQVTGCGALSGSKQDLSINVYHKGCQLLTHDDVIGTRRISYILYLPDPDEPWDYPKNGGALRLYPTVKPNVPAKDWTLVIPPAWNQLAFFTVQPGLSFHDVEEVFVDKERASISGWFHIPQEGEEGFIEGEIEANEARSSLQQLESDEVQEYDFPKKNYDLVSVQELEENVKSAKEALEKEELSDESPLSDIAFKYLSKFMNPTLLKSESINMLSRYFLSTSAVEIRDFLKTDYAKIVKKAIDDADIDLDGKMPKSSKEVEDLPFWKLSGPPHKTRYMYVDGRKSYEDETKPEEFKSSFKQISDSTEQIPESDRKLAEISVMLKSNEFREWLSVVTSLNPIAQRVLIRRFRPGYDYTLATTSNSLDGEEEVETSTGEKIMQARSEMTLEGTLCLTPTKGWEDGELGGYELSMLAEDDDAEKELDPAVYRGSSTANRKDQNDDDDAVLLTCQADWNVFSLMARDSGILKFVKYVSGCAPGSRWDISSEWPIENSANDAEEDE